MTVAVHHEATTLGGGLATAPASNRSNTGRKFAHRKRLDHVVVAAKFEPNDAVHLLPAGGGDDDGHVRRTTHLPQHVKSVAVGQTEIEQDEVGIHLADRWDHLGGVGDEIDVEAIALEPLLEGHGDGRVIFHHEDTHVPMVPRPTQDSRRRRPSYPPFTLP